LVRVGDHGLGVVELQRTLTQAGFYCQDDEGFGVKTELAVRRFQFLYGLPVTGEGDAKTIALLKSMSTTAMQAVVPEEKAVSDSEPPPTVRDPPR
jgi:peptidoglycan hydrolase-like protein with peptidoglycan-binding domain